LFLSFEKSKPSVPVVSLFSFVSSQVDGFLIKPSVLGPIWGWSFGAQFSYIVLKPVTDYFHISMLDLF
jgi:hypothetical protein